VVKLAISDERKQGLRTGDVVEVRSKEAILATLDERARLDGLPFMPEMLPFCGRRFRVQSIAHKTCDTVLASGFRRMENAVHLAELRCDGSSHGGCQASCLLFWNEAWLKPVKESDADTDHPTTPDDRPAGAHPYGACTIDSLIAATRREKTDGEEEIFSCQATELREYTTKLRWWDARQYAKDVKSGNVGLGRLIRGVLIMLFNKLQTANSRFSPRLTLIHEGRKYPFIAGALTTKTPKRTLDLQPGDLVKMKSREEIVRTLDTNNRNRGLSFDGEMSIYCGRTARVIKRVTKIIDERTGKMLHLSSDCIMLAGVVCTGNYMQFCPRRVYSYWREIWLDRIE